MSDPYDQSDGPFGQESPLYGRAGSTGKSDERIATVVPITLVVAGLLPVSWFVSSIVGYALAGALVCLLLTFGIAVDGVPERLSPAAILLGLYWLLLIPQFAVTGELSFLPYILLTPVAIVTLVVVAPGLIERNPARYAAALTGIVLVLTGIGIALLIAHHAFGMYFAQTGRGVLGLYPYRISSLYSNANYLGFVTSIGMLSALYLWLESRREQVWLWVFVALVIATLLTNNRTAIVTGVVGSAVLLGRVNRRLSVYVVAGAGAATVAAFFHPAFDDYFHYAWVSLIARFEAWEVVLVSATENPFVGTGFDTEITVHNSYLAILLHAGFVAGWLYILAVVWALVVSGVRMAEGTLWDAYVFATLVLIAVFMTMESTTIGGLTTSSLLAALYVGLADRPTASSFGVDVRKAIAALAERDWRGSG